MAKKVNISAETYAKRWQRGLQGASEKIKEGVNAVSESPGKMAAEQADVWLTNIQNSRDKWAKNVAAVPLDQWKQAMIQKGIPAQANAINMAMPKVQSQGAKVIAAVNNALSDMPPRGTTPAANLARVEHMMKRMSEQFNS